MVEKYAKSLEGLIAVYDPDAELTTPHEIDYIKVTTKDFELFSCHQKTYIFIPTLL